MANASSLRLDRPLPVGTQIVVKRDGQGVMATTTAPAVNCHGVLSYSIQYRYDNAISRVEAEKIVFIHP